METSKYIITKVNWDTLRGNENCVSQRGISSSGRVKTNVLFTPSNRSPGYETLHAKTAVPVHSVTFNTIKATKDPSGHVSLMSKDSYMLRLIKIAIVILYIRKVKKKAIYTTTD